MKELDFDELDRAVNTLMSDVKSTTTPPADDDVKTLTITPTLSVDTTEAPASPFAEPARATTELITRPQGKSTPPASRRAGRFMDVVHPSSDMRTSVNVSIRPVSRSGVTIEPVARAATVSLPPASATVTPAPTPHAPVVAPEEPSAQPVAEPVSPASDWPDPLAAYTGFDEEPATNTPVAPVDNAQPVVASPASDDEDGDDELFTIDDAADEQPPLTTPFLANTKVEKRPLGTAVVADPEEPGRAPVLGTVDDDPAMMVDPENQLPADPVTDIEPRQLPEELQSDLMAVESDATPHTDDAAASPAVQPLTVPVTESPEPTTAAADSGPTSITQQYNEAPTTGDQTNGAIYDTQAYHQPLAHPAKKKSGWLWVVWVIVLLMVGAGGAAALYLTHAI